MHLLRLGGHLGRLLAVMTALVVVAPPSATAGGGSASGSYEFASPLFGLAAKGGSLFVADAGAGVVRLRSGNGRLIAELPGVTDVAPITATSMWAVTGAPNRRLYRITDGVVSRFANLGAFEADVNPDGGEIDSNPFDVAALPGGRALVADAAANALLIVKADGTVDWVATLPERLASTKNLKRLVGCPDAEPDWAFACDLPERIPAQAVATSVAVGPDGAWYVGELKGFPAPRRSSRVWRIEPGTRHAECGSSPDCSIVAEGLDVDHRSRLRSQRRPARGRVRRGLMARGGAGPGDDRHRQRVPRRDGRMQVARTPAASDGCGVDAAAHLCHGVVARARRGGRGPHRVGPGEAVRRGASAGRVARGILAAWPVRSA